MTKCQVDMESLRRDCKRKFGSGRPGDCPHCGMHINTSLSRHVMNFHLALGQLWRCPIPLCSVWKGTAQYCVDHLRHQAVSSVVASKLDKWFPPCTVTCATWAAAALGAKVSGIATDLMLSSQHWYRVYGGNRPHQSLRGSFMMKLSDFTHQASADARSVAKRGRDFSSDSTSTPFGPSTPLRPPSPLGPAHRTPDSAPPVRKSARATVTWAAGASADAPALTEDPLRLQIPDSRVPMAPAAGPVLLQFVVLAPGQAPAPAQSPADEFDPRNSPPLPGSRTSTPTYELLSTDTDVPLSASWGAAAAVPLAGSPLVAHFEPINLPVSQELRLSLVLLSPNRVRQDFDVTTEDLYLLFDASPVSDGHSSRTRHQLTWSVMPSLSIAPVLVRCQSPTRPLSSRSCHPSRFLFRQ